MTIIKRSELSGALDAIKGAVASKAFAPILTHVYVTGKTMLGYDSEIGIRVNMNTDLGCTFNVHYNTFASLIHALDGEDVDLSMEGKRLRISCGKHRSTMMQMEEAFPVPEVKPPEGTGWQNIPAGFKEGLERALIAVAPSERLKVLSCVLIKGGHIYGTTGQEVVRCTLPELDVPAILLAQKAVEEVLRLGNPVRLMVADPWAVWDYTNLTLITRLREGAAEYPPVDKLFERETRDTGPMPDGITAALTRLSLFVAEDQPVFLRTSAIGVELTGRGQTGDVIEYLDPGAEMLEDKAFSAHKLLHAIPFAEGISWGDKQAPVYLRGQSAGFEYLLAPMRG